MRRPTPALGWQKVRRDSRGRPDLQSYERLAASSTPDLVVQEQTGVLGPAA